MNLQISRKIKINTPKITSKSENWTPAVNRQPEFPPEGHVKLSFALKINIMFHACRIPSRLLLQHFFQPEMCQIINVRISSRTTPGSSRVPPEWFWMHMEHPGRKYFQAENHHFRPKYFPSCRVLPLSRSRDLDNPRGSCFREMKIHTQSTMEKYLGPE